MSCFPSTTSRFNHSTAERGDYYLRVALEESQEEPQPLHWIVRACQNRALQKDDNHDETTPDHLRERVLVEDVLFTQTINVRGRKTKVRCDTRGRKQRFARVCREPHEAISCGGISRANRVFFVLEIMQG